MYICHALSLVIHHDYSPYSAFDNNPVYWSDPSGADSKPSIHLSFQGDAAVQWVFDILVSIGTYTDKHDEKAALYGFDSFEEFINSFRADKNPESNNDSSADGNGGPGKGTKSILPTNERVLDDITHKSFLAKAWSRILDGRTWIDEKTGNSYRVGDDGKIIGFVYIEIGNTPGMNLLGGRSSLNVTNKIISLVKSDAKLMKLAKETFKGNSTLRTEVNALINQLSKGNINPGIGTKSIGKSIFEARSRGGARVYFRNSNEGIEILGYSHKGNQEKVIETIFNIF